MNKLTTSDKIKENIISINPKKEPLTPDKLRELTGLDVTDEKADEIIHSIRLFCKVLYEFSTTNDIGYIMCQSEINIYDNTQKEAA